MIVYFDSEYRCHTTNPDGVFKEFDDPFFDGKCTQFIEGYCCHIASDGRYWITPWKNYDQLAAAQRNYERQLLADYRAALTTLGVTV